MKRLLLLCFTACCSLMCTSCVKNADVFTEYHMIDNFTNQSLSTINVKAFDAANDLTIIEDNYRIEVPKNAFLNEDGESVSGMVLAKYILLENVGDFIRFNFNTVGNESLLDAAGIFYIQFEQNGKELFIADEEEKNISFFIPKGEKVALLGQYLLTDSGWVKEGHSSSTIELVEYTTGQSELQEGYKVSPTDFGWVCLGSELGASDGMYTICAELPENHNNVNTVAYATLERNTAVVALRYNSENFLFCGELEGVPSGQNVKVTAISDQGFEGLYNFGTKSAVLDSDQTTLIEPTMLTRSQVDAELEKL